MAWFPTSSSTKYKQKALEVQFVDHTNIANDAKRCKGKISIKILVGVKKKQLCIAQSALSADAKFAQASEIQISCFGIL